MTTTNELTLPQRAAVALGAAEHEKKLALMAEEAKTITEIKNKDAREQCHSMMMTLKNARIAIEKTGKAAREDAQAFSNAVIAEQKRLIGITQAEEDRLQALRDKWDADREAERQAKIEAERQRVSEIKHRIGNILGTPNDAIGRTSIEIKVVIDRLEGAEIGSEFQEFTAEAEAARAEAVEKLKVIFESTVAQEAEATRLKAEREELARLRAEAEARRKEEDRIAAERRAAEEAAIQAERDRLAAERAELELQQAEMAEAQRAIAEAKRIVQGGSGMRVAEQCQAQDERSAFEQWAVACGGFAERKADGDYRDHRLSAWWFAWQARASLTVGAQDERGASIVADQIIADYKEHYDFPSQGESHMHDCITSSLASNLQAGEPVAYAVVSELGGIHKMAIKRESAERKAAAWAEEWPNNKCRVRPLVFGDAAPQAQQDTIMREFDSARLRRVVNLLGLSSAVPEGDLSGCMGAVLGMVARKIGELQQDVARLDWLIRNEVQVWEVNRRYSIHEVTEHHAVTAEYMTPRDAINSAMQASPAQAEVHPCKDGCQEAKRIGDPQYGCGSDCCMEPFPKDEGQQSKLYDQVKSAQENVASWPESVHQATDVSSLMVETQHSCRSDQPCRCGAQQSKEGESK